MTLPEHHMPHPHPRRLKRDFFERPTLQVAETLIGKTLIWHRFQGYITETEAYVQEDPACHAARGRTARTEALFGPAGHAYVYFIYGMYFCLNVVTEREGYGSGVLLRGLMLEAPEHKLLDGPGKLCRHLGVTKADYGLDFVIHPQCYFTDEGRKLQYKQTPRIGISQAKENPWRFVVTNY